MTLKLSYSSISLHRQCPQAWQYRYLQHLDVLETEAIAREFGSWWHAVRAADAIRRGHRAGSLAMVPPSLRLPGGAEVDTSTHPESLLDKVMDEAERAWRTMSEDDRTLWAAKLGDSLTSRLREMNGGYLNRWGKDLQTEYPIAVEVYVKRAIKVGDETATLVGVVDEVYRDTRRNLIVAKDHKANREIPQAEASDDLMDSQLHLYGWLLDSRLREWLGDSSAHVNAVAYDRARSLAPKMPQLTKAGKLSKSVTDYDLDTYLRWSMGEDGKGVPFEGMKKDGSGAGVYITDPSEVQRLSSPAYAAKWFDRTLTPVNVRIVKAHLREMLSTGEAIQATTARVEAQGEASRNLGRSCKWCDYSRLCLAQMVGGPEGDYEPSEFGLVSTRD